MATTTKIPLKLATIACALFAISSGAFAQVQIAKPKIEISIQKTPRFSVQGPKEQRDTQKHWLQCEVEFTATERGGNQNEEYIEEIEFKYYITVKPKAGVERKVYTITVPHINIPKGDQVYSVVYMSPTTLGKIIGKSASPSKSDIDVAVEIRHKGALIAGDATKSPSSKWWTKMAQEDGKVLNKYETPFAPLWWDRYVEVKGR